MEPPVINLSSQFQLMRAQMEGLKEGIETRKLVQHFGICDLCLTVW